ncbi:single-stranded-DNA-specific exonuclease RecJ [Patescibacteria group bacterium]
MDNWKVKEKKEIGSLVKMKLSSIILQLLFQRGIDTEEKINNFLTPDYERDICDPFLFSDMKKATKRFRKAKEAGELVAIFGDYDADGVTSTAIIKEALDEIGIRTIIYIPDKKTEGYGMNIKAVNELKENGVNLIITVDCGITNVEEIAKATEYGIDVIVADHHNIPKELPDAFAIINPKMEKSNYPKNNLAGVGVAFKVVQALYEELIPEKKEHTKWMLDLVAIGTVADCVPLLGENRALVKYGMVVLSKTRRVGLKEIMNVARLKIDENNPPKSQHISFQIAPRINAAGRMDHANTAYNLIIEKDTTKARNLALELESNNKNRQKATQQLVSEVRVLANNSFKDKKFIFASGEHFSIGIVGLVAGKIAEEFNKPTAILQKKEKISEGSFRSIPQLSIIKSIEMCSELLVKFGGHDQAAGIRIENKNLELFFKKLSAIIEKELKGKELSPQIKIDAEIMAEDINFELTDQLKKLEPFGEGNQKPVFIAKKFIIKDMNLVGSSEKHLKLLLRSPNGSPKVFDAIGFNFVSKFKDLSQGDSVDVLFNLEQDEWNGTKKIQMKLIDLKKV